ncbi:MAG: lysozyme inhibitor LprI family protein [Hydrogenophaga sp.]|nr:lysozyme inhibitor LprI family protein [Hydrogenophaga sp.]
MKTRTLKPHLATMLRAAALGALMVPVLHAAPSFDCARVAAGSIAERVCRDPELARLDRQLAEVYAAAQDKARNEHPATLRAEQRGWIKGRDDCWKSTDITACVAHGYQRRIAELQARYRLLPPTGTDRYACQGDSRNELLLSWFATQPATVYAERGDSVSWMFREAQPAPVGGVLYIGRNESLRLHNPDQLWLRWGVDATEITCVKQP